jgi:hypothetical protein
MNTRWKSSMQGDIAGGISSEVAMVAAPSFVLPLLLDEPSFVLSLLLDEP